MWWGCYWSWPKGCCVECVCTFTRPHTHTHTLTYSIYILRIIYLLHTHICLYGYIHICEYIHMYLCKCIPFFNDIMYTWMQRCMLNHHFMIFKSHVLLFLWRLVWPKQAIQYWPHGSNPTCRQSQGPETHQLLPDMRSQCIESKPTGNTAKHHQKTTCCSPTIPPALTISQNHPTACVSTLSSNVPNALCTPWPLLVADVLLAFVMLRCFLGTVVVAHSCSTWQSPAELVDIWDKQTLASPCGGIFWGVR